MVDVEIKFPEINNIINKWMIENTAIVDKLNYRDKDKILLDIVKNYILSKEFKK